MEILLFKCTKCGAIQQMPNNIEEDEPCMFCGGYMERQS
jgi:hypothetical protein